MERKNFFYGEKKLALNRKFNQSKVANLFNVLNHFFFADESTVSMNA